MTMKETVKYKIIENYILEKINSRELNVGDQIETELELSEKFKIGRITVNKALINLSQRGYIKRVAGRGSFVLPQVVTKNVITGSSFTEDMASVGLVAGSKLIEYRTYKASEKPEIAQELELEGDDLIHFFVRLRTGNNEPIAVSYSYISAKVIPAISLDALEKSLSQYLHSVGVYTAGSYFKISAHLPTEQQKKILNIGNMPLLLVTHITYNTKRIPFEHIDTFYLSSQYVYTFKTGYLAKE